MNTQYVVSTSPHIRDNSTTQKIMLHVIIALLPALIAGVYYYGLRAFTLVGVTTAAAVLFEWLWQKLTRRPITVTDFSAALTGMILGLNLPVATPYAMAIIGALFAILVVKQFFGGIGHNFMNPAMAARAFLLASWPVALTNFVAPHTHTALFGAADAVSQATPLASIGSIDYLSLLLGEKGGCIGEVCIIAILLGFVYLLWKRIITPVIPVSFIGTVFLFTWIAGSDGLAQILSGGLFFGAVFMATDYVTCPIMPAGQWIFGIGCGLLTAIIRLYGGYPEGVTYAILLMNAATPLIDKVTVPRGYGYVKGGRAHGKANR